MKGTGTTVMMVATCAMLGFLLISPKSREPKQVQDDIAVLQSMEGKSASECLLQLNSADERQRWAAACELKKNHANLYLPQVHAYLAQSKDLRDSATQTLLSELVSQRTVRSEEEMASLLSSNPMLAPVVSANYLHGRDMVPKLENWLSRQTDPRVLQAMASYYSKSPSPLGRSLYSVADRRLKELS